MFFLMGFWFLLMLQRCVDISFGRGGTVIVTLMVYVYVEFEMWLAFIHLSKILWKHIPMLSVSDSVIHTDFVSTRFPHFVQLTHCYWWWYQVWLILWNRRYLFSSPAFNDGVFVSRSSTSGGGRRRSDCCALLGRCQIGHTNLCSQSSIRFVRLKLSKTLPKTPHLFTTYLIPSYFFHFFHISSLSQSSS